MLADDARRCDQDVPRRDVEEFAHALGDLASVLDALLAGADVRAAARGDNRLGPAVAHMLLRDDHWRALDLVLREHRRGAGRHRRVDEREVLLTARLDPGCDSRGEDAGDGGDAAFEPLDLRHARYGYTGGASRPVRSSQPIMMFRFCTPFAEPPLPRLSMADTHTARRVRRSATIVTSQKFEPTTARVAGRCPSSRTRTNGSPA